MQKFNINNQDNNSAGQISRFALDKAVGIKEIAFKDKAGKQLKVVAPHLVQGAVVASSVLEPAEAYNPDFLFDAR